MSIFTPTTGLQYGAGNPFHDFLLTNYYRPVVADAINNEVALWSYLADKSDRMTGKAMVFPVHTTGNEGHSAVKPGGSMPDAKSQGAAFYGIFARHLYGTARIDGVTLDSDSMDGGSFADAQDFELNGLVNDIVREYNRILNNDGSGRLGEANGGASVTVVGGVTVTIKLNQGLEGSASCTTAPTSNWLFRVGMRVGVISPTGTLKGVIEVQTIATSTTITAISTTGGTVTVADNDWLVRASVDNPANATSLAYRAEPMGLEGIMSDGDIADGTGLVVNQSGVDGNTTAAGVGFQGVVASAVNPWNQAVVLSNGGTPRPLTEDLMQTAISEAARRNNSYINMIHSDYDQWNNYAALLRPDKRYTNTTELHGGQTVVDFNGVGWMRDRMAYANRIKFLGLQSAGFSRYTLADMHYVNGAGWQGVPGEDAIYSILVHRWTCAVDVRERAGTHLVDLN